MKKELNVRIGNRDIKCFFMNGFFPEVPLTDTLHKHNYTEIHITGKEEIAFELENKPIKLKGYGIYAVPEGMFHRFLENDGAVRRSAFLIDCPVERFSEHPLPPELVEYFFGEIEKLKKSNSYSKIAPWIALLCSDIFPFADLKAEPITDQAFIIDRFISLNYNKEVSIAELSEELHLSERQTVRQVLKYTGLSFKQALISYRMKVARHLSETTDMSLSDIAESVGYKSYNGFWKTYTKYPNND